MRWAKSIVLFLILFAPRAHGTTSLTLPFPEVVGSVKTSGFPTRPIDIDNVLDLPAPGQKIVGAIIAGSFGNKTVASTAPVDVFLNGFLVARCTDGNPCSNAGGPYGWSLSVSPDLLNTEAASLTYVQTGAGAVNLGPSTLTLVMEQKQTITFGAPPAVHVNGTGTVTAETDAMPSVKYPIVFSTTSADCSVTSVGVVTGIKAGSNNCVIEARQAGDNDYASESATQALSIGQDATTLTLSVTPNPAFAGRPVSITLNAVGNPPTGTVTFCDGASVTNATCTGGKILCMAPLVPYASNSTTGCTVTFAKAGRHVLSAYYAGDDDYAATATTEAVVEQIDINPDTTATAPMLSLSMLPLLGILILATARSLGNKQ